MYGVCFVGAGLKRNTDRLLVQDDPSSVPCCRGGDAPLRKVSRYVRLSTRLIYNTTGASRWHMQTCFIRVT